MKFTPRGQTPPPDGTVDLSQRPERALSHSLQKVLPHFLKYRSSAAVRRSPAYRAHAKAVEEVLSGCEYGSYNDEPTSIKPKKFYRAVFWNLSGALDYRRFVDVIKTHPILRKTDFFLFSDADIGMARTMNGNVVRNLALDLSYNYVFSCSYLHLPEPVASGGLENQYGLSGQAVMTPHPLSSFRVVGMPASVDPMRRAARRIGRERTLCVRVELPEKQLALVCNRLDPSSSPRQRARQLGAVLKAVAPDIASAPLLFGGGLNTTTYNSRHAVPQFFSFFNKVIRGYDYICEEHHAYPERFFERRVFALLRKYGLDYESLNEPGRPTFHGPFEELEVQGKWEKKLSHLMVKTIKRFFYHGPEQLTFKLDWFAGNARVKPSAQPQAERPKALAGLFHDNSPVAAHDPIVLDFEVL